MQKLISAALLLAACSDYNVQGKPGQTDSSIGQLEASPSSLSLGPLAPGETTSGAFEVTSTGSAAVRIDSISLDGARAFTIWTDAEGLILSPGESAMVLVTFEPSSAYDEASVFVESNAEVPLLEVPVSGTGVFPELTVEPLSLYLESSYGEEVTGEVMVSNSGHATLTLSQVLLQAEDVFHMEEPSLPVYLEPTDSLPLEIVFRPTEDGTWSGRLWLSSDGGEESVSITGVWEWPCLGLAEAWDQGLADAWVENGSLYLANLSEGRHLCLDRWYVFITEASQDMGGGDPAYNPSHVYGQDGSIVLEPGEEHVFPHGAMSGPTWWCVEQTQLTRSTDDVDFYGAQVPPPLLEGMLANDNQHVWDFQLDHPVFTVGRTRNHLLVTDASMSMEVDILVTNMGRVGDEVLVEQTVPAGAAASGFSQEPEHRNTSGDGSVTYGFRLALDGAIDTPTNEHTIYDMGSVSFQLRMSGCEGRTSFPAPTATWTDLDSAGWTSTGSPLILDCP